LFESRRLLGHFKGKERDGFAVLRGVAGDVEGQRCLAHAGSCGDDDERAWFQADDDVVEVTEPGSEAEEWRRVVGVAGLAYRS
jgi:hypothetical protein